MPLWGIIHPLITKPQKHHQKPQIPPRRHQVEKFKQKIPSLVDSFRSHLRSRAFENIQKLSLRAPDWKFIDHCASLHTNIVQPCRLFSFKPRKETHITLFIELINWQDSFSFFFCPEIFFFRSKANK